MKQKTEKYSNLVHKCTVFEYFSVFYANYLKHNMLTFIKLRLHNIFIIKMFIKKSGKDPHTLQAESV